MRDSVLREKEKTGDESDEGCDSERSRAWGSLKDTARELIEGVVGPSLGSPSRGWKVNGCREWHRI
jgi:hypothetical protein